MKNSASDNNKGPKRLVFFNTSGTGCKSEYGLFNSTGQLLKGNELFEQYNELAKQLDTKRSSFYLQLEENEIIFGCSLIVKADNGREERVVFIQVNNNLSSGYDIESNIQLLKRFYEAIKFEIETFELKKYQLIGLWSEGDFRNIKEVSLEKGILEYTAGKINTGNKVSIKILELSNGLSLIIKLIVRLSNRLPLIFDVSQYPSESDVSVSLIKPNPDFEIGENGDLQKFVQPKQWTFYEKLGEKLFKDESYSKGSQNRSDYISPIVEMILDDPKNYYSSSNSFFDDFDDRKKVEISRGLIQNLNNKNNADIVKILINIYGKTKALKSKKDIHVILLSNEIYIKELIEDLIKTIYEKKNNDFFDVLFNDNTSSDNPSINYSGKTAEKKWQEQQEQKASKNSSKYNSFEKGIKYALKDLEYSQKVNFVKFIVNKAPSKPEEKGIFLLENLIQELHASKGNDFILDLSDKELKNLGEILDADVLTFKKELKKEKRKWIKNTVSYAGLFFAIILIVYLSYNLLTGGSGANNSSNYNQTNTSKLNGTHSEGVNLSGNNSPSNTNSTAPIMGFEGGNNLSSNNPEKNETNGSKGFNNSSSNSPENNST